MLSYRHAFHAGNFADVLKHLVLQRIVTYLIQKSTPVLCIDTHAGAGCYDLTQTMARKNQEFMQGIGKLWQRTDCPEVITDYLALLKQLNPQGRLQYYPGSPWIMQKTLRTYDRLCLFELHPSDVALLRTQMRTDRRVQVEQQDGLQASIKLLPPRERRGVVFIDPAYEVKSDYAQVVETIKKLHRRFASAVIVLWYPVVERQRNCILERSLQQSGIPNIQLFELGIMADNTLLGMTASGLVVINPPWTLAEEMRMVLPWLAKILAIQSDGHYRIIQLVPE